MIEKIKEKIWDMLKAKEVSLVMIFTDEGEILWHRGRKITESKTLAKGCGYCSTPAFQAVKEKKKWQGESCPAAYIDVNRLDSARPLRIKSLVILPVTEHYFLYVDSGTREGFSERDVVAFETMGSLLGEMIQSLRSGCWGGKKLSGASPQVATLRDNITKYAIEEEPVLLLGETGVGKTHVAEMIHLYSGRPGPFVVVNTPGIPDTLIEAQLFGHGKGAFTGAVAENDGFVASAKGGTLFLDEIGELLPVLQSKLLRFLDSKAYHRLGETRELHADVRIIAATNQDLRAAVARKTFRDDLFFRLDCLAIEIPPLRERKEDIPVLIAENEKMLRGKRLTRDAMNVLMQYHWPGNVRELLTVLKLAGIHFSAAEIGDEVRQVLRFSAAEETPEAGTVERVWEELRAGKNFWEAVKRPYLQRDLKRSEVVEILNRGLKEAGGKYIELLRLLNLQEKEYKSFMSFIYKNDLK